MLSDIFYDYNLQSIYNIFDLWLIDYDYNPLIKEEFNKLTVYKIKWKLLFLLLFSNLIRFFNFRYY